MSHTLEELIAAVESSMGDVWGGLPESQLIAIRDHLKENARLRASLEAWTTGRLWDLCKRMIEAKNTSELVLCAKVIAEHMAQMEAAASAAPAPAKEVEG
jgi:hypothetical protein